jgi:hypothetical protein
MGKPEGNGSGTQEVENLLKVQRMNPRLHLSLFIAQDLNMYPPEVGSSQARPGAVTREDQSVLCYEAM